MVFFGWLGMRVHLQSCGCRLNEAELQGWAADFRVAGHVLVADVAEADVAVVNTCAVTGEAGRKSRQMVRRAHRLNADAKLVVSGCYATLEPRRTAEVDGVALVVANRDKDGLVARVDAALQAPADVQVGGAGGPRDGRCRAFVKVQDGCRWRCSYCVVTLARGAERSTPVGRVVEQVNRHCEAGVEEVVLSGVHLGGYGGDCGSSLYALTRAVLADTGVRRLRFGSLEPWGLDEAFFGLFADGRLLPHLHVPLQSGSDSVLRRMARRCRRLDFAALVEMARASAEHFNVTTDIIVGFPGESEAEWREGLEFIAGIGFGDVHIFPFSARAGTRAAGLPGRVAGEVVRRRQRQLQRLAGRMRDDFVRQNVGAVCEVLLEGRRRQAAVGGFVYSGYTGNYVRVGYAGDGGAAGGRIVRGRLDVVDGRAVLVSV